jgi:DNA-binding IscR family transcriptional regulator
MADNHKVSAINGAGTYGGYRLGDSKENEGLLEVLSSVINNGEPVGYLTAENVIQLLKDNCHVDEIVRGVKQDIAITLVNSIIGDQ